MYKKVDSSAAVPKIYLDFEVDKKTLKLRIDFFENNKKLPPAGYLSESRINLLGFSMLMSAIKKFNKNFPFIYLDDIISSYDTSNRLRIADLLVEQFHDFQLIITTHDEMFYRILKKKLDGKNWTFHRIKTWSLSGGPTISTDKVDEKSLENFIKNGDPNTSGNMLRQLMEDWFDSMCEKYEAKTIHKRGDRAYDYALYELMESFIDRVKKIKGNFYPMYVDQPYNRLRISPILNQYSHSRSNPNEISSIEDISEIWTSFKEFKKVFCCFSCTRLLEYSSEKDAVYCVCGKNIFSE
jgi:wobble nucleotide-excising tRNase